MASAVAIAIKSRFSVSAAAHERGLLASVWWSLAGAIVARGSNVLVTMICARALSQERFGELAIVLSTVGMFGPLAGVGLGMTTAKYLAEHRGKDVVRASRVLGLSLAAALACGLLMAAVLVVAAPALAARSLAAPHLASVLALSSGLVLFGVFDAVQTGALAGLEAFYRVARLSLWNGLLSLPVTAILVYRAGVNGALWGMTLSLALGCLLNAIVLRREARKLGIRPMLSGCWGEWRMLLRFSLPSYLAGILVAPATWAANALLVNRPGGYPEMALYSAADRWRCLLIFVPLAASRIAVPLFARLHSQGDRAGYGRMFRANLWLSAGLTVIPSLACVAAAPLLMNVYGDAFRRGWLVLAILAFSAIPTVFNTQLGSILLSRDRAWTRMAIDFLLAALFLGISWWAVPRWAAAGLAAAFAAAYTVATLVLWLLVRKIHANA